jgi:hypothetical protein
LQRIGCSIRKLIIMATYIVCNGGGTETRQVANAGFQLSNDIVRTYTQGDCNVIERSNILRFNSFTPCDTDFTIWYTNTYTTYIDGAWQSIVTQYHTAEILAGDIYVEIEVLLSRRYDCGTTNPSGYQQMEQ